MISFNKCASGEKIRVNLGRDLSAGTSFAMALLPNRGCQVNVTPTVGTEPAVVGDTTFLANQYLEYTTTAGMFGFIGKWKVKAVAVLEYETVSSDYEFFRVKN